jgi:hypothetical protein
MDTSVDRARAGLAGAKTRHGLVAARLRERVPGERAYKVTDRGNGLQVVVSPGGSRSFRYDCPSQGPAVQRSRRRPRAQELGNGPSRSPGGAQ